VNLNPFTSLTERYVYKLSLLTIKLIDSMLLPGNIIGILLLALSK
jgi:hypothetical protein